MADYIDISLPLSPDLPVWPGSLPIAFDKVYDMDKGDPHTDTDLHLSAHSGTHIDAPGHFIKGGNSLSDIALERLVGPSLVVALPDSVDVIGAGDLKRLNIPEGTARLLIKTRNSALWATGVTEFHEDFVALGSDAAQWIVNHGIDLVAIDYLSIQPFHHGPETHHIILGAGIVAVEGVDLSLVEPGHYDLICLPLKLIGTEGGPVRALLKRTAP